MTLPAVSLPINLFPSESFEITGDEDLEPTLGLPDDSSVTNSNPSINSWLGETHSGVLASGYHQIDGGNNRGGEGGNMDYLGV